MLNPAKWPIWWQFSAVCFLGFIAFVLLPLWLNGKICQPHPDGWTVQGYTYPAQSRNEPDISAYIVAQKKAKTKKGDNTPDEHENAPSWFCREAKAADFFLVYFTFCLVVVGWFTMRSADANTKKAERAYLFGGGPYGLPVDEATAKLLRDGLIWPEAKYFKDPKRMTIQNYGKTAGFVTKMEWGLIHPKQYPGFVNLSNPGLPVSDAIEVIKRRVDNRELPKRAYKNVLHPVEVYQPTGTGVLSYRHVQFHRKKFVGYIFYGRIWYDDVFGEGHYSTFRLYLNRRFSQALGDTYGKDSK